jgi:hypothetical protein
LRNPAKKIIHSELKTITSSPRDAVGDIVEQVIVMGQEGTGETGQYYFVSAVFASAARAKRNGSPYAW